MLFLFNILLEVSVEQYYSNIQKSLPSNIESLSKQPLALSQEISVSTESDKQAIMALGKFFIYQ